MPPHRPPAFHKGSPEEESLTPLGNHLASLPVDCRVGKLILLGAMFGVADSALTIAATLSSRSPFMSPPARREEADRAKRNLAFGQSDHLTALRAYLEFDSMGPRDRFDFARENFLGIKTLQTIAGLKRQLLELLSASGFVAPGLRSRAVETLGRRADGSDGCRLALEAPDLNSAFDRVSSVRRPPLDTYAVLSEEAPLLKALLVAALFPQVSRPR